MEAALSVPLGSPPQAAGPQVLAGPHRTGARRAADARVAMIVEGVVRDIVRSDVALDLADAAALIAPLDARVEAVHAVVPNQARTASMSAEPLLIGIVKNSSPAGRRGTFPLAAEDCNAGAPFMAKSVYHETYQRSMKEPAAFWAAAAEDIYWDKRWDRVCDDSRKPWARRR